MNGTLHILPDARQLTETLADTWVRLADAAITQHGAFYVALAGGSTPRPVYAALAASTLGTGLFAGSLWGVFSFGTAAAAAAWSLSTLLPGWVANVTVAAERGRVLGWIHLWWNAAMVAGSAVLWTLSPSWVVARL